MTKKSRLCLLFFITLLCSEIVAQSEFSLLFNFATSSVEDTLIESQLFDYDNDSINDFVFVYKDETSWKLRIFNQEGAVVKNVSDSISIGADLKFAKLFEQSNIFYLALLSKIWSDEVEKEIKFRLEIIDIQEMETVDVAEGYTWDFHYGPSWYDKLLLQNLNSYSKDSNTTILTVGWESYDEWTDIGETSGTSKYQNTLLFKFNGQFLYNNDLTQKVNQIDNCYKILPISNLGIGGYEEQASGIWGGSYNSASYINSINFENEKPTSDLIAPFDFYRIFMLSSDDSTNYDNGIMLYRSLYSWPVTKKYCMQFH
jgi:hypothetical protein